MLLCAVVGSIWVTAQLVNDPFVNSLQVSVGAAASCGVAFIVALIGAIVQRKDRNEWAVVAVVVTLGLAMLFSIETTGGSTSPYVALWMLAGVFAALGGIRTFIPLASVVLAYGIWLAMNQTGTNWVLFGVTFVLPLVISYFLWYRRFQTQEKSENEVSELAQELNQESNKSEIIVNAIADGVLLIDKGGIVQLINPAAQTIIGWRKEDALKLDYRSVLKLTDSKDQAVEDALDPIQQCLKTNEVIINDKLGIKTTSGKKLQASLLVSPLGTSGGGVIVVFRDVTAQLVEEREQAEFISTASHEMRTPVAAIEGYLGLALNPSTATIDEKARSYLAKAHESAQHLGRLFQDLLDISKIEDGRMKSSPTIIDMVTFTRGIIEDFTEQFREKGLNVIFRPDNPGAGQTVAPIFYVNVDQVHMHEILGNLVSNAIKYSKEGTITIDVTGTDERVNISVTDTGIGIPAEDLPHMFQKFYRVDNTDTREIGGTGLGLYLSRRLTESMGGQLTVESVYGTGSTFTIDLPRVSREEAQTAKQQVPAAPQPQT